MSLASFPYIVFQKGEQWRLRLIGIIVKIFLKQMDNLWRKKGKVIVLLRIVSMPAHT